MSIECTITNVFWERILLHIKLKGAYDKRLYLRNDNEFIYLKQNSITDSSIETEVVLNMSTVVNRTFIENGTWKIGYFNHEQQPKALNDSLIYPNQPKRIKRSSKDVLEFNKRFVAPGPNEDREDLMMFCSVADSVIENLARLDRIFRYDNQQSAYTIDLSLFTTQDTQIGLSINSFFMRINEKWDKHSIIKNQNSIRDKYKAFIIVVMKYSMNLLYLLESSCHRRKHNNILFLTEVSTTLQGNLSSLYNRIKERKIDQEFSIETSCRKALLTRSTLKSWIQLVKKIAKANLIIIDNYVPILTYLKLDRKTKIVQVWHAGAGFKAIGYMRFGKEGSPHPAESVHKKYTYALAPSESLVKVFEEVFGIEEDAFIKNGMPRLDGYLQNSRIESFKEGFYKEYPELMGKRIILFAPTYRGKEQKNAYYDYTKIDFEQLYQFCKDEYMVIIKMHPYINDSKEYYQSINAKLSDRNLQTRIKPDISKYKSRIIDLTDYPSINDLFYITDILITDYSSVYYEFSVFKRPILFYTYDRLFYESTQGVYMSVKDHAPGKVCNSFEELMEALISQDYEIEKTIAFSENELPQELVGFTDKLLDSLLFNQDDDDV